MTLRVLHVVSVATMTGPADPALSLAAAQRHLLGLEVAIGYDTMRAGDMARRVVQYDVPAVETLALCTKGGLRRALADRRALAALGARYDVIHAHASHDHGLAALAGKAPLLVRSIHHPRSAAKRVGQGWVFGRTGGFFVPAEAHRALVLHNYPTLEAEQVLCVPGAVDPAVFHPGLDGPAFRREVGLPPSAFVVGMVARFQPGRRQEVLIEAVARARASSGLDLWLAFMGKGETQAEVEAAVGRHGLGQVSRLLGFRDADLGASIRACDVTVLLKEGSDAGCRAVLQSLACGVPVVGARYPAIEDALEGGEVGALVAGEDVGALAAALVVEARRSPDARAARAAEARARVEARYTERGRAERVVAAYAAWLGRESPARITAPSR
jgi:glycosyltransferase involved in cell wall biosynthesis